MRAETLRMINGEEGLVVEYKKSVDGVEQDDFVALANAKGGTILVGVEEGRRNGRQFGKVVGCNVGEENRRKLINKASSCLPAVNVRITVEGSRSHKILRVDVVEAAQKPCCTQSGTYKIRKDGTKVAIDPELMTGMILERESKEFLSRFTAAGDAIIAELNKVRKALEEKLESVERSADEAAEAARDAQSSAENVALETSLRD
jgi:ATP-dependent DNA helicase RecG